MAAELGSEGFAAAAEMSSASAGGDGPVMSLMSKRLRALRKKYNRILQMEERVAQGKPLNPEQEDVLRSKPAVSVLIEEYERLRAPLSSAVQEELQVTQSSRPITPLAPPPSASAVEEEEQQKKNPFEDLLALLYFGSLFDVKPQSEFTATMLTRTHERGCCLTYDYVTDDATDLLGERDLDAISALGALLTSRPACSGISHKGALLGCVEHAKLWLSGSDQPILEGSSVTYAGLRGRLNKILASDYFITTPEMKAPVDVAAAVEKYTASCQVQSSESNVVPPPQAGEIGDALDLYQHKDDEQEDFQETAFNTDQCSPIGEVQKRDEADDLHSSSDVVPEQQEQEKLEDLEQSQSEESKEHHGPRRSYLNQRGGNRGGARRGYPNGRGGRGGRGGGYQNGRSQYNDSGFYPRNYINTRGRGGRSGGAAVYSNHRVPAYSTDFPRNIELDTNG